MAKTKPRTLDAGKIFDDVQYDRCPECGADISERLHVEEQCRLCSTPEHSHNEITPDEVEILRRDLNERIDQITDTISRKEREFMKTKKELESKQEIKRSLDRQLQDELARYDSAFFESIRSIEREIATMKERIISLERLRLMPEAIGILEEEAGALQGKLDRLRSSADEERLKLRNADSNIAAIAEKGGNILLAISYPVSIDDNVVIEPKIGNPCFTR